MTSVAGNGQAFHAQRRRIGAVAEDQIVAGIEARGTCRGDGRRS